MLKIIYIINKDNVVILYILCHHNGGYTTKLIFSFQFS